MVNKQETINFLKDNKLRVVKIDNEYFLLKDTNKITSEIVYRFVMPDIMKYTFSGIDEPILSYKNQEVLCEEHLTYKLGKFDKLFDYIKETFFMLKDTQEFVESNVKYIEIPNWITNRPMVHSIISKHILSRDRIVDIKVFSCKESPYYLIEYYELPQTVKSNQPPTEVIKFGEST